MGKGIFVPLLALLCFTSTVFAQEVNKVGEAPAPSPHHRSHHHGHHQHAPAKSPVHPPAHSPVHPPAKSPVHTPAHSPGHSPAMPPAHPPAKMPAKPPMHPPAKSPVKPPVYPPKFNRSLVAVQGVVFCKDCKYSGVETLIGAKPVKGAVVRLMCKNKRQSLAETQTDDKGYFLLLGPKTLSNYGFKSCRVYLVKSPMAQCSKVAKLNGGHLGGVLKPVNSPVKPFLVVNNLKYGLFNVGPFAFEPACPR